jgi:hypothetical protein
MNSRDFKILRPIDEGFLIIANNHKNYYNEKLRLTDLGDFRNKENNVTFNFEYMTLFQSSNNGSSNLLSCKQINNIIICSNVFTRHHEYESSILWIRGEEEKIFINIFREMSTFFSFKTYY